jgi:hypothetical protein
MGILREWFDRLTTAQAAPSGWLLLGTALLALGVLSQPRAWLLSRHLITLTHEGGHALVAVASGRRLEGVRLHSDTSGVTLTSGRPTGFGMAATAAAGYLAPSVLGVIASLVLARGYVLATLVGFLVLLASLMVRIRNAFGFVTVTVVGAVLVLAVGWAPLPVQAGVALAVVWFLLLAGPRPVVELQVKRRRGQAPDSDADQLARLTRLPGLFWVSVFFLVTFGGAAIGVVALVSSSFDLSGAWAWVGSGG